MRRPSSHLKLHAAYAELRRARRRYRDAPWQGALVGGLLALLTCAVWTWMRGH